MVSKFKERNIGLVYFINFEIFAIFKEGGRGRGGGCLGEKLLQGSSTVLSESKFGRPPLSIKKFLDPPLKKHVLPLQ